MKTTIIAASSLLAAVVVAAQPHGHQHQKHHEKREIVWQTEVEIVTETIPITTTIWVDADEVAATATPSSDSAGQFFQTTSSSASVTPTTLSTSTSTPPASPPSAPKDIPAAQPPKASTTPVAAVVPPVVTPPAADPPVATPPVAAPPVATPTVAEVAPSPSAVAPAAKAASGYTGACASGSPCSGDITFYTAGLGACGEVSDGDKERIVALPYELMGTQSNGNPFCGMTITVSKGGKTTTAIVADKCMGCQGHAIDLSNLAFSDLASFDVGRTEAEWWFN